MNEATLRKEFEEWVDKTGPYWNQEIRIMYEAWVEATRRANKRTRHECADLCNNLRYSEAWKCAEEIRATIPEE